MEEIFGRVKWFGNVNVLFVKDLLQLPQVNGKLVFEGIINKSVASKLGCMISVDIQQDTMLCGELTLCSMVS